MNGSDALRSAFNVTKEDCCWVEAGAKAEADAERSEIIAADFIIIVIRFWEMGEESFYCTTVLGILLAFFAWCLDVVATSYLI